MVGLSGRKVTREALSLKHGLGATLTFVHADCVCNFNGHIFGPVDCAIPDDQVPRVELAGDDASWRVDFDGG